VLKTFFNYLIEEDVLEENTVKKMKEMLVGKRMESVKESIDRFDSIN
jgi:hypothetical protein